MNCETKCPAIRLVMFPADTNPSGNIFGGIILSHIDVAGAIAARLHSRHRMVTVCMKEVVFKKPVKVGDILTCWTEVTNIGRTSVTVKIRVEAERHGEVIHVTDGEAIYVSVDAQDKPIPLASEPVGDDHADISPAPATCAVEPPPAAPAPAPAPAPASPAAPATQSEQEAPGKKAKKEKESKGDKKNKKNKAGKKDKKDKKDKKTRRQDKKKNCC
jgi:acyl-CoA thioesterase YciA